MQEPPYPWLNHYPEDIDWHQEITPKPVYEMLASTAQKHPTAHAFDFLGKKYTWHQIHELACKLAKGLQDQGIEKGQHVGIFLPNTPYYLIAYYAILMSGATVINLNPLYAEEELETLIEDSEADMIITTDLVMLYEKMHKMLHNTRLKQVVICPFAKALPFPKNWLFPLIKGKELAQIEPDKRTLHYKDMTSNQGDYTPVDINPVEDLAVLQYTGGTTGLPKGAMLTHANIYTNTMQAKAWFTEIEEGKEKMLGVLPFFHVFAMTAVMNFSVLNALEIIGLPRFELEDTLKVIHKKKPDFFPAVPAIYSAINNSPLRKKYDLSSLKYCLSGGAPLAIEIKKTFEAHSKCVVIEGYGLSESSPVACVNPVRGENKAGSIGLPFPQTIIEILDHEDRKTHMPIGKRGELCIRGPQVMKGYWKNESETKQTMSRTKEGDMRLHTGDIAIMDEQGYSFIVDRIKDMIITNGYNVYPRNIEEAIYKHPNIEECIVAGLPDKQRGEIVKAWIKLKEGRELNTHDLKEFLKDKISPMEIPKRIEFRGQPLPKTIIGKLSRKDIVKEELEKHREK